MDCALAHFHVSLPSSVRAARRFHCVVSCRYNVDIGAVLIAYGKLSFATSSPAADIEGSVSSHLRSHTFGGSHAPLGRIVDELAVVHVRVTMEALLFTPRLGELLAGRVNLVGPGHVSCLVAGLFNASVLGDELAGGYEFEAADGGGEAWVATSRHTTAVAGAAALAASAAGGAGGTAATAGSKRKRAGEEGRAASSSSSSSTAAQTSAAGASASAKSASSYNRI